MFRLIIVIGLLWSAQVVHSSISRTLAICTGNNCQDIRRELQATSDCSYLSNELQTVHPGALSHTCPICSVESATCTSTFAEVCNSYVCGVDVDCVDVNGTIVEACMVTAITSTWTITIVGDEFFAREVSRELSNTFTKGVTNIKEAKDKAKFDVDGNPVSCELTFDGQKCNSCQFCPEQDPTVPVSVRMLDCSNFDPDAVDNLCERGEGTVMQNILIMSSKASSANIHGVVLGLVVTIMGIVVNLSG